MALFLTKDSELLEGECAFACLATDKNVEKNSRTIEPGPCGLSTSNSSVL